MSKKLKTVAVSDATAMPLPAIKNNLNGKYFPKDYQTKFSKSQTVSDDALTIKQILERHTRHQPTDVGGAVPIYHGEDAYWPEYKSLDLAEIEDLKRGAEETVREYQSAAERRKARQAHVAKQKAAKDLADKEKQKSESKSNSDDKHNAG